MTESGNPLVSYLSREHQPITPDAKTDRSATQELPRAPPSLSS